LSAPSASVASLPLARSQAGQELIPELVVISGKGGTGKTSLTAAFAMLARDAVVADCDVDAADLHLVLEPDILARHVFQSGHEAMIREADCDGCGDCLEACRFDAIACDSDTGPVVDTVACEGCGVCQFVCPRRAIDLIDRICGEWFLSNTRAGPMVHARLGIAAENSGKLVSTVRAAARRLAIESGSRLILVDGPPGIGCPVISSITGADAVLVVTEPSVSGAHDLDRVLSLTRHFRIPAAVCVNRWDLDAGTTQQIEDEARSKGAAVMGRVRYDAAFTEAQIGGKTVVELDGPVSEDVQRLWELFSRPQWWRSGTAHAVHPPSDIDIQGRNT
jgi:MinD superfamily P-loop ATPase